MSLNCPKIPYQKLCCIEFWDLCKCRLYIEGKSFPDGVSGGVSKIILDISFCYRPLIFTAYQILIIRAPISNISSLRMNKEIFIYRTVLLFSFGAGPQMDNMSTEIFPQSPWKCTQVRFT